MFATFNFTPSKSVPRSSIKLQFGRIECLDRRNVSTIPICSTCALYRSKDVFSCFVLHSNEFLEKSGNVLIEGVPDVNECLRKCMQAPLNHKLKCETVMYNVNTRNCVLSKYTREERKIRTSERLQIDLYENKCATESDTVRLAVYTEQVRTTTAPFIMKTRVIYSKIVLAHATPYTHSNQYQRQRFAKTFQMSAPRPLVDSTSTVSSQFDATPSYSYVQRRQRSDNFAGCFTRTPNRVLPRFEESKTVGVNLESCIRSCALNQGFYCASINYNPYQKICIMNGGNVHLNNEQLYSSREYDYYENTCQPKGPAVTKSTDGVSTKKECYHLYNNSIYNSFDATIIGGLSDLESCESECSWSHVRRHNKCVALNWISSTRGCMLFHKTVDFSNLIPSINSVFLINTCAQDVDETKVHGRKMNTNQPDYYDQPS
ncbi:unnamed protein product [Caenorhabditis bovis]|uniref:Apple domain-containing protein n=1 Tax=Caenorhabditis bovis TaxID=2654633 RepID=A0A8S1F9Y0_9PELO|nr:unnamed protein product [Caenorhabditis bovis]